MSLPDEIFMDKKHIKKNHVIARIDDVRIITAHPYRSKLAEPPGLNPEAYFSKPYKIWCFYESDCDSFSRSSFDLIKIKDAVRDWVVIFPGNNELDLVVEKRKSFAHLHDLNSVGF